ncbi:MAG: threonine-phosphate decarboxylase [Magnetococcales bacterium]|nr:threonine-phosphate decarboxylase [Magnetococcales bacterium]
MLEHGGGIREAAARFGGNPSSWLDLSTGINPNGYPAAEIPVAAWNRLPEAEDGLEEAARAYFGCTDLLPAAGSQAIIQALPTLRARDGAVAVLSPTYAEHAHAWRRGGFDLMEIDRMTESLLERLAVLVVVNPNNPTARRLSRTTLLSWWQRLNNHGGWLIVDEAFMDAETNESLAADTGREGLLVLRGIGKFFGLAGARVGFLLGPRPVLASVREQLGPWNVAGPSRWLARMALTDRSWQCRVRESLQHNAQRLTTLLKDHGLDVAARTALFQWVPHEESAWVWEALAHQKILVRRFDAPRGLRFGLPGTEMDWLRLATGLKRIGSIGMVTKKNESPA